MIEDINNRRITFSNNSKNSSKAARDQFEERLRDLSEWSYTSCYGHSSNSDFYVLGNGINIQIGDDLVLNLKSTKLDNRLWEMEVEAYLRGAEDGFSIKDIAEKEGII